MSVAAKLSSRTADLLRRNQRVHTFMGMVRQMILLGPLNPLCVWMVRRTKKNPTMKVHREGVTVTADVETMVEDLRRTGVTTGFSVDEDLVQAIYDHFKDRKAALLAVPHKSCELIEHIARNETIVEVVRQYLQVEPCFNSSSIFWRNEQRIAEQPDKGYRKFVDFHYDTTDFQSLILFVYLTDMTEYSNGAHTMISGTHGRKSLFDLIFNRSLKAAKAEKRFGSEAVRSMLGPRGTAFLEDTSAFHRGSHADQPRMVLCIDYSAKSLLSA